MGKMPSQWTEDKDGQNPNSHLENRWGPGTRMLFPNQRENRKAVQDLRGRESKQCGGNHDQRTTAGPGTMGVPIKCLQFVQPVPVGNLKGSHHFQP